MVRKEVEIQQNPLDRIFVDDTVYQIPLFQREYKWTKDEGLEDFWSDLLTHYNEDDRTPYHFGPTMLINEHESNPLYRVVDGQQRLTTSLLFLVVVRDYLHELAETEEVKELERLIYWIDDAGTLNPRMTMSAINNDYWLEKVLPAGDLSVKMTTVGVSVSKRNAVLANAYIYLGEMLQIEAGEEEEKVSKTQKARSIIKLYQHFIKYFTLVENIIADTLRAFKMFERINNRGLPLGQNDLAKNYLLELINGNSKTAILDGTDNDVISAYNQWSEILNRLDTIKVKDNDFLRHYLMAFLGPTSKVKIFDKVQEAAKNKAEALQLIDDLDEAASIYSALKDPQIEEWYNKKEIVRDLSILKTLNAQVIYPVLLKACKRDRDDNSIGDIGELIHMLLIFFFRSKTICSANATALENLMNKICLELKGSTASVERIRTLLKGNPNNTANEYPNDDKFRFFFKDWETTSADKSRYILSELEFNLHGGVNRSVMDLAKAEVEHIMPKTIEKTDWDTQIKKMGYKEKLERDNYHKTWINKLGNKTILAGGKNAAIQNLSFKEKVQKAYSTDQLKITSGLAEYPDWNHNRIQTRQKKFADDAVNIWKL